MECEMGRMGRAHLLCRMVERTLPPCLRVMVMTDEPSPPDQPITVGWLATAPSLGY